MNRPVLEKPVSNETEATISFDEYAIKQDFPNPRCDCGQRVTLSGCSGCGLHPFDCSCGVEQENQ